MKYKKYSYILVLVLMLIVGINHTYAVEGKYCYYISDDNEFKSALKIQWGYKAPLLHGLNDFAKVSVDKIGSGNYDFNDESVLNWWSSLNFRSECVTNGTTCFDARYGSSLVANEDFNPSCPKHLVFQYCKMYAVWATDSETIAKQAVSEIRSNGCTGFYGSFEKDGDVITAGEYYEEFVGEEFITIDNGNLECNDLLGEGSGSLREMIDTIMEYVRIIVPILIILLGTVDFAKAVIAGKEDNMKKAQKDFVIRIIAGVAVFFVPVLIDIIMDLAEIVWQGEGYKICNF